MKIGDYIDQVDGHTECDICEFKEQCIKDGEIIPLTHDGLIGKHYTKGRICVCRKKFPDCYEEIKALMP
jgi:hypothetical protein